MAPVLIGTGIGRELLRAAHQHAADRGFTALRLWVLRGNQRARRFYERAGYTWDGAIKEEDFDGVTVAEVRYHRPVSGAPAAHEDEPGASGAADAGVSAVGRTRAIGLNGGGCGGSMSGCES